MGKMPRILVFCSLMVLLAACYQAPAAAPAAAPASGAAKTATPALSIVSPAEAAAISGGEVSVSVKVDNFTIKASGGANKSNEGHLHMKLDGGALTMVYGDKQALSGVPAGKHTLEVELVNNDHSSFSPPIKKTVSFSVSSAGATTPASPSKSAYDY